MSDALDRFRAAVSILFKPGECAVSLFAYRNYPGTEFPTADASIICLSDIQSPEHLPPYWTLSTPSWYHQDFGNIDIPGEFNPKKGNQVISGTIGVDDKGEKKVFDDAPIEVFPRGESPFLVFESDDLLFNKDAHPSDADKKLQKDAMAYAFIASGFPFAVLVDSGSKSIHATVRLEDDLETIKAWRAHPDFLRLQDLCAVVFGDYDDGVLKQSGRVRLVRTPGAIRENGKPQSILATGQRTTIAALMQWFMDQLNPLVQQEIAKRPTIVDKSSTRRQHYLRLDKWRLDLVKPHAQGLRSTEWFYVSKTLMVAGMREPKLLLRPSPQVPYGKWQASWIWYVSAYVHNHFSNGWFFSSDSRDWEKPNDRPCWRDDATRREYLASQLHHEKALDPEKNALVDQMQAALAANPQMQAASQGQALPPPPAFSIPPHFVPTPNPTGATTIEVAGAGKSKKVKKPKAADYDFKQALLDFSKKISSDHLIKLSPLCGDMWYRFFPLEGVWRQVSSDSVLQLIQNDVFGAGSAQALVKEFYGTISLILTTDDPWVEYPNAIAFRNGTLYLEGNDIEFVPKHDPADKLRSLVPCHYDPSATCPRWDSFVQWALPDLSRLSLLQEAFGYTLIPGQQYQKFFMLTGVGSNGKSVVLSVLQAMHKDSFETVALANLGGRFSLGTLGRKRLAIDTEAENVVNAVSGEGNSATAILKSWTGGDPVKIEAKRVQGWSETINAKYIMSCNKKPRFVDPTKGVWRRLMLLKFEAVMEERQADTHLGSKLSTQELPGIINWAIVGLRRLHAQNGFTQSATLKADLSEYQIDSDSVALFVQDFMRPIVGESRTAWFDIRPFHKAYKDRCLESGNSPVSETEFRQRLEMLGVGIGRPDERETVNGCPVGFERAPGPQHWSIKGWRCHHPGYTTQSLVGSHVGSSNISGALQGAVR